MYVLYFHSEPSPAEIRFGFILRMCMLEGYISVNAIYACMYIDCYLWVLPRPYAGAE